MLQVSDVVGSKKTLLYIVSDKGRSVGWSTFKDSAFEDTNIARIGRDICI